VTPTYLDQYIAAARDVSLRAVGNGQAKPARAEYVANNKNCTVHIDGLPLGTRDGLLVEHHFPADGEYVFNLSVSTEPGAELRAYPHGWLEYRHTAILTIDGVKVFEASLGGEDDLRDLDHLQIVAVNAIKDRFKNIRVPVTAGDREVVATFIARDPAESDYQLESFVPGEGVTDVPQMRGFDVVGPYSPTGISVETRSRERIFVCRPASAADELPWRLPPPPVDENRDVSGIGDTSLSATYSLPRVRMIFIRPSASKVDGASAHSERAKQRTDRRKLAHATRRQRGDIGHIQESTTLIIDPKKMAG